MLDNSHRLRGATRPCPFCPTRCLDIAMLVEHFYDAHISLFPSIADFMEAIVPLIRGKSNTECHRILEEQAVKMGIPNLLNLPDEETLPYLSERQRAVLKRIDESPRH